MRRGFTKSHTHGDRYRDADSQRDADSYCNVDSYCNAAYCNNYTEIYTGSAVQAYSSAAPVAAALVSC
jgi:hypothetical protein